MVLATYKLPRWHPVPLFRLTTVTGPAQSFRFVQRLLGRPIGTNGSKLPPTTFEHVSKFEQVAGPTVAALLAGRSLDAQARATPVSIPNYPATPEETPMPVPHPPHPLLLVAKTFPRLPTLRDVQQAAWLPLLSTSVPQTRENEPPQSLPY